jgi:hypothetical protein
VSHSDFTEQIHTTITTPTKGANAMKGIANIPFILALMTTELVVNTTTMIFQEYFWIYF